MAEKVFLITGGTGSLGTRLTHHLLAQGHKVRTLSRNEHGKEKLERSLHTRKKDNLSSLIGDVRDLDRLRLAMDGVTHVIHAAAMKVVPICERDPYEAVLTNIVGTMNVARAINETTTVERAVFIGTDKLAEPSTTYGATKLVGMRVWLASNQYAPLRKPFVGVIYANVLGSAGSILHIFRKQAEKGSIQITHKDSTRFHLRMEHAVELVMNALDKANPGEIIIPKLNTYRVVDFAEAIAPGLPQEEIGLRMNEKINETMISANESMYVREEPHRYIMTPGHSQGAGGWSYASNDPKSLMTVEAIREEIALYDKENA